MSTFCPTLLQSSKAASTLKRGKTSASEHTEVDVSQRRGNCVQPLTEQAEPERMPFVSSWYFKENAFVIRFDVDVMFWLIYLVRIGSIEYKVKHSFESQPNAALFAASANQEPNSL